MKRKIKRWSKTERAFALKLYSATGGKLAEVSRMTGIPEPTLHGWAKSAGLTGKEKVAQTELRSGMLDVILQRLYRVLVGILDWEFLDGKMDVADLKEVTNFITAVPALITQLNSLFGKTDVASVAMAPSEEDVDTEELKSLNESLARSLEFLKDADGETTGSAQQE